MQTYRLVSRISGLDPRGKLYPRHSGLGDLLKILKQKTGVCVREEEREGERMREREREKRGGREIHIVFENKILQ